MIIPLLAVSAALAGEAVLPDWSAPAACRGAAAALCPGTADERLLGCLEARRTRLSPACRRALDDAGSGEVSERRGERACPEGLEGCEEPYREERRAVPPRSPRGGPLIPLTR